MLALLAAPHSTPASAAHTGTVDDPGQKPDSDERPTLKRRADQWSWESLAVL